MVVGCKLSGLLLQLWKSEVVEPHVNHYVAVEPGRSGEVSVRRGVEVHHLNGRVDQHLKPQAGQLAGLVFL